MAIALPASTHINVVATTFDHTAKTNLGSIRTGSYLSQASMLVYDDILRFQNSTPKVDVIDNLTPTQKKAVYQGIKTIYQPMYGVSGSQYYDETYFNLLKGYVGSYFYKEYDWFNTDQSLNILEFAALNIGNALYQFIDAVATDETITEAYNDYAEQAMGTYRAYQQDGSNIAFLVKDELKDKRLKIQLYDDPDSSGNAAAAGIVYAGFDAEGELVVWDSESYPSIGTTADITKFVYNNFEGNILWFMDELVGIESDWRAEASPGIEGNTAYSYVQFTEDSVDTAVNRYVGHLKRFNERSLTRDWEPYTIKRGDFLDTPEWLTTLKNSTGTHKEKLDALTYDEMLALAFVHLHSGKSKDSNFVLLAEGNIEAAKDLYKNNHHTNPDAATLTRLERFFPHRKQNIYADTFICSASCTPDEVWMKKCCVQDQTAQVNTPDDVINALKSKVTLKSGDELFSYLEKEAYDLELLFNENVVDVTDETANMDPEDLGAYSSYHYPLNEKALSAGSNYKVIKRQVLGVGGFSLKSDFYFYRTGGAELTIQEEWLQSLKAELTNNAEHYNCDELCQTILAWNVGGFPVYILDWFALDVNDDFLSTKSAFGIINGFASGDSKYVVFGSSFNDTRTQFGTVTHEVAGHAGHLGGWGDGDVVLLTTAQNIALDAVYNNWSTEILEDYENLKAAGSLSNPVAREDWLNRYILFLPMANLSSLESTSYDARNIEDELLARIYSIMALNKCITFTDDIWPVMKAANAEIATIIPESLAKEIDTEMREKMLLNYRTYS